MLSGEGVFNAAAYEECFMFGDGDLDGTLSDALKVGGLLDLCSLEDCFIADVDLVFTTILVLK